jgi:hypothetical protein
MEERMATMSKPGLSSCDKGGPFALNFLGLKPQVKSYSPFGTKILERHTFRPEHAAYSFEPLHRRSPIQH